MFWALGIEWWLTLRRWRSRRVLQRCLAHAGEPVGSYPRTYGMTPAAPRPDVASTRKNGVPSTSVVQIQHLLDGTSALSDQPRSLLRIKMPIRRKHWHVPALATPGHQLSSVGSIARLWAATARVKMRDGSTPHAGAGVHATSRSPRAAPRAIRSTASVNAGSGHVVASMLSRVSDGLIAGCWPQSASPQVLLL